MKGGCVMKLLKEADFRREIKNEPATAYLFFGDEDYTKNHAITLARECIVGDESLAMFNEMKLDALTYSPSALADMLATPPMMAERKLIVISGLDFISMKVNELDALISALSLLDEYDFNTVIISAAADKFDAGYSLKSPSATLKKLSEVMTPVIFEKNSPARLAMWAGKHYEHNGVSATPDVAAFTVDYCGRDMYTLAEEIKKISYYALSLGRTEVTLEDVRRVGVNSTEYDTFAFANAICAGNKDGALNILLDMKRKKQDPIMIMGEVSKTVCDILSVSILLSDGLTLAEISKALTLHEYKVSRLAKAAANIRDPRRLLAKCRAADLDIKSMSDGYMALEKLICTM